MKVASRGWAAALAATAVGGCGQATGSAEVGWGRAAGADVSDIGAAGQGDAGLPDTAADAAAPDVSPDDGGAEGADGACARLACPTPPPCKLAWCDGDACAVAAAPDGSACDDGQPCTAGDACKQGLCQGKPFLCGDGNPCTVDTCKDGGCLYPAAPDGAPCEDGDVCSVGDTCQAGACKAGGDACAKQLPAGLGASPCQLVGDLPKASAVSVVPWFTALAVNQPIFLTAFPDGSDRLIVVERPGRLHLFANDPAVATKKLVLDLTAKVSVAGEGGLLSVAFHPKFKQNKKLYVNYTSTGTFTTVVSEFTMGATDAEVADPASEKVLLSIPQPYTNHNGGQISFDGEGFLLVGMGDGGGGGDPLNAGQDKLTLLGKMLRIDVDAKDPGKNYAVPKTNPFVGDSAWLPEIFALGLRNPWRFSVDRATGTIWAGDVGQNLWEEIDIIEKGKNYGWRQLEGSHCFNPKVGCVTAGMTMPVAELPHGQAGSINGGYVYRGSHNPSLYGAYVFSDYVTGRYWSLTAKAGGGYALAELADTTDAPVSFGEDRDGELYAVGIYPSKIWKIVVQKTTPPPGAALPSKLSATGCFSTLQPLQPAAGMLPYEVNAPLWSDGAAKSRWLVLPAGSQPKVGAAGPIGVPSDPLAAWEPPPGSLIIKHFALGDAHAPVETRFMRRDADGWRFFTFRWSADGKDADLWLGGGSQPHAIAVGGKPATQIWTAPSTSQCAQCHRGAQEPARVLGLSSAQLDRGAAWSGGLNQLAVWAKGGVLSNPSLDPAKVAALPALGGIDGGTAPIAAVGPAARAYLHANCAHCHRPGGASPSSLDLRYSTPLASTGACGAPPQAGDLGIAGAAIVKPGAPAQSTLAARMTAPLASGWLMPSVGVTIAHTAGAQLIADWIGALDSCAGP